MKLTPKQERFAQLVAEGKNLSEAYRLSYNAEKMKPETVNREAKALIDDPKISTRVEEIRKPIIERTQITLDSHLRDLMMLRNMAVKEKQISAAIAAEVARGKAAGIHVEKSEVRHEIPEVVVRYID
jgi:phage terminase small subunit